MSRASGVPKNTLSLRMATPRFAVTLKSLPSLPGTARRRSQGPARGIDRADEGFQLPHRCVRQGMRSHGRVGNAEANGAVHRPIALAMRELATRQRWTAATAPVGGVAFSAPTAKQRRTRLNVGRGGPDVADHRVWIARLDEGSYPLA